ncbi:MAG: DNA replication/repair protein RecF [Bacteroidetes bacterium]|nr:DNA replication/repair protein RecF [Bacteroidota bacterium]
MFLQHISLVNFKNYSQLDLEFNPKINCFTGDNGVGKTNLLDAFYYLSFCKSYFNPLDSQNIRHEEPFFVIQGTFQHNGLDEHIYCGFKQGQRKQFKRNKKEYEKLSDHIGLIPLVMVSPADSVLVNGGSEERRKFMDGVISQFDRQYLEYLLRYNRALAQRNKLLKDFSSSGTFDTATIEIWDEQLVVLGTTIHEKRKIFISDLIPVFRKYYDYISNGREEVNLLYDSQLLYTDMRQLLNDSLHRDRLLQHTTQGVHKDDLQLDIGGHPVKKTGSQGQQKTYLTALKLAQFEYMHELNGFPPILLLDDIFDKLDAGRVRQIIELVGENRFGQIFITDTGIERLERMLAGSNVEYKIFMIGKTGTVDVPDYCPMKK